MKNTLNNTEKKNTTIDRINVNGNYEPFNVRWATLAEQNRNMRTSSKTTNLKQHSKNRKNFITYLRAMVISGIHSTELFEHRFGISLNGFRKYIESQFVEGMSWSNNGWKTNQWEFDHIEECYKFDLSKEEDLLQCFNYKNIKPSWATINRTRSKIFISL